MKFFLPIAWLFTCLHLSAGLKFESELIEVNADLNDKTVTRDFKFTNDGTAPITIKQADGGCTCLEAQISGGKLAYAPGESGVIRAIFELGSFQGTVDKPINIWLQGDPEEKPSHTITMRVHIPQIITLEPRSLKWEIGGDTKPLLMDVKMDYEKPIHILKLDSSSTDFATKLITVEEGKHYQIEVTPTAVSSPGLAVIRIETDLDVEKQRIQQGFAVMKSPTKKP